MEVCRGVRITYLERRSSEIRYKLYLRREPVDGDHRWKTVSRDTGMLGFDRIKMYRMVDGFVPSVMGEYVFLK